MSILYNARVGDKIMTPKDKNGKNLKLDDRVIINKGMPLEFIGSIVGGSAGFKEGDGLYDVVDVDGDISIRSASEVELYE